MKKRSKQPLIDDDGEVRELTLADMRKFRPAREVDPKLVAAYEAGTLRVRGRPKSSEKSAVSLRLDNDILAALRATGDGWQSRVNDALRAFVVINSKNNALENNLPTGGNRR